jgi:heme/copper-type cytochrome/quinol oxidase subunit 1
VRRYLWVATVLGLAVVTIVLFVTSTDDGEYGWFAYTPGSDEFEIGPDLVIMSHARIAAWGAAAMTLALLAAGAGYALGRRSRETGLTE